MVWFSSTKIWRWHWTDIITGDETGNAAHLDLGANAAVHGRFRHLLQNTLHLSGATAKAIEGLPMLSQTILALIGDKSRGYPPQRPRAAANLPNSRRRFHYKFQS